MEIFDSNVATVERLHDLILEKGLLPLGSELLTEARELSQRMSRNTTFVGCNDDASSFF